MPKGIPASGKRNYTPGSHPGRAGGPGHPRHGRIKHVWWMTAREAETAWALVQRLRREAEAGEVMPGVDVAQK